MEWEAPIPHPPLPRLGSRARARTHTNTHAPSWVPRTPTPYLSGLIPLYRLQRPGCWSLSEYAREQASGPGARSLGGEGESLRGQRLEWIQWGRIKVLEPQLCQMLTF